MKKMIIGAFGLLAVSPTLKAQTTFGVKAGVQNNLLSIKTETGGNWNRVLASGVGFQAGGVADIGISSGFSVQPNLLFSMKSVRTGNQNEITMYTIDVPINLLYKSKGFFIGAGPNLSYGLSAKQETPGGDDDLYEEDAPGTDEELNRFEAGVNVTMGYQFNCGLAINSFVTQGFSNLNNESTTADTQKIHTRQFGLSLSWMFGKKAAK